MRFEISPGVPVELVCGYDLRAGDVVTDREAWTSWIVVDVRKEGAEHVVAFECTRLPHWHIWVERVPLHERVFYRLIGPRAAFDRISGAEKQERRGQGIARRARE